MIFGYWYSKFHKLGYLKKCLKQIDERISLAIKERERVKCEIERLEHIEVKE